MNMFRWVFALLPVVTGLWLTPLTGAYAADVPVYKGELKISIPAQQSPNSLLLQYRTRAGEVLRIGVNKLAVTNTVTNQVIRLENRSVRLAGHMEEGYLGADIVYDGLSLDIIEYRIDGSLTTYLSGSQQARNFSIYITPESGKKATESGIDWGSGSQRYRN